ncbi:MAG: hypothetical protein LBS86_04025 [Treponema sp.]|jgi:hypothetical protein|nr:hypothetical protein [Treponema sp.]
MEKIDIYSLLWAYISKGQEPFVKVNVFVDFIEKYAKRKALEHPEWSVWSRNASSKFWQDIAPLVAEGKCVVQGQNVFLPRFYVNLIQNGFATVPAGSPIAHFPDETILGGIQISSDQYTQVRLNDFIPFLQGVEKGEPSPHPIIKLELEEELGHILLIDTMLPTGLLNLCLEKIRYWLSQPDNMAFATNKLTDAFHDKDIFPQQSLDKLVHESVATYKEFEEGNESVHLLWAYLCVLIKSDMKNKMTEHPETRVILQAATIIERFNSFYKEKTLKLKGAAVALAELDAHLLRSPYVYTLDHIIKFTDIKGKPLLSHYSNKELDEHLDKKTTDIPENIPELIILTDKNHTQWFVNRTKLPLLCLRMIVEAQSTIRDIIINRWKKLLMNYESEDAMEEERDFQILLTGYLKRNMSLLASAFDYPKLMLFVLDMKSEQEGYKEFMKLFDKDTKQLLPLSTILVMKRKNLLSDARNALPFWYSIPVAVNMLTFFRRMSGKKSSAADMVASPTSEKQLTFKMVCKDLEAKLVPSDQSLDDFLIKLWERWAKLIKEDDRKNLMEDVNSLVRANIRKTNRLLKPAKLTEDYLSQTAADLIKSSTALKQLQDPSLELYIKLYIVKQLSASPR